MKQPRLPQGSSDPVSYVCTCACSASNPPTTGLVLLFYRYFSAPPQLPFLFPSESHTLSELSSFHESLTTSLSIGGKIRVGTEGFNGTVAGRREDVERYIEECVGHWSFEGLDLGKKEDSAEATKDKREAFFKPTTGCACVFGGAPASVRTTSEITPMGVTGYVPREWGRVKRLLPEEFHALCWGEDRREEGGKEGKMVLLDVRNHYESRIGYFVDPRSGNKAVRPDIRRFAQWPAFVRRWVEDGAVDVQIQDKSRETDEDQENGDGRRQETENGKPGRKIMAYCTGGIRCEKATRWMVENASMKPDDEVYTLEGGIQAYLTWMAEEIRAGRKTPKDSLFKGRNYVFDARGSLGLGLDGADEEMEVEPVAACHICGKPEDRLSKCRSQGCHLVLVVCEECEEGDVRCCGNCRVLDTDGSREGPRPICLCEMERETKLWGDGYSKKVKAKGRRKGKERTADDISIQVKPIN